MIPNGSQTMCIQLGKAGCYFISICKAAENHLGMKVELLTSFAECVRKNLVQTDGFVMDAGGIMTFLTGEKWLCLKAGSGHELPLEYTPRPGEIEILRFERSAMSGVENAHFVLGDGTGRVAWDPIGVVSNTVANGKLTSKRLFRRVV